jgi:hypothetical protein
MNHDTYRLGLGVALGTLLVAGCQLPPERLNAPPQGHTANPHEMQAHYVPMVDNALLAEMSMSPAHFVPNNPELNGLGARRLTRYSAILKVYGGTLHYDGLEEPERLAEARMDRVRHFLVASGLHHTEFAVQRGVAGGTGMAAGEAGRIREASAFDADHYRSRRDTKAIRWDGQSD